MEANNYLEQKYCEANSSEDNKEEVKLYTYTYFHFLEKLDSELCKTSRGYFALPFQPKDFGWVDLLNAVSLMGYEFKEYTIHPEELGGFKFPCLIKHGETMYCVSQEANLISIYDPRRDKSMLYAPQDFGGKIKVYTPQKIESLYQDLSPEYCKYNSLTWFSALAKRFRGTIYQLLFVTFILHFLSLSVPVYIMVVYDKVINAHQMQTLTPLTMGVIFVVIYEFVLRMLRALAISKISSRVDYLVNTSIVDKIFGFPASVIESTSNMATIARIRSFTSLRDFFSGPIFLSSIETPFIIVMLVVLGIINIYLVIIPLISIVVFSGLMIFFYRLNKKEIVRAAETKTKRQKILVEFVDKIYQIRYTGLSEYFQSELAKLGLDAAKQEFRSDSIASIADSTGRGISLLTAVATLILGAELIWQNNLSVGGLIAAIFITWRILNPLQTLTTSFARIEKLKRAVDQVNTFMLAKTEHDDIDKKIHLRKLKGKIELDSISVVRPGQKSFLFKNSSLNINPGEFVIVTGKTGSGKSTFLKLINGMHKSSAGSVFIDGYNINQINLKTLREQIYYAPQYPMIISGTVLENLTIYSPYLTREAALDALEQVDALDDLESLSEGLDSHISIDKIHILPRYFINKLSLARIYLNDRPIILIDNLPNNLFEGKSGEIFKEKILNWHTKKTIIMVTFRSDLMKLADRVIHLKNSTF